MNNKVRSIIKLLELELTCWFTFGFFRYLDWFLDNGFSFRYFSDWSLSWWCRFWLVFIFETLVKLLGGLGGINFSYDGCIRW